MKSHLIKCKIIKMETTEQTLTSQLRARLLMLAIASTVTLVLAVTLVIILSVEGFTGITSKPPIVLNSCTNTYYSDKYSSPNYGIAFVFCTSLISIFLEIAICVLVLPPLILRIQPTENRLAAAFILVSLQVLSVVVAFGRYVYFRVDLRSLDSNCSISYSQALIDVVLAIALADFVSSCLQAIFMLWSQIIFIDDCNKAQKYKIVSNVVNLTSGNIKTNNNTNITIAGNTLDEEARRVNLLRERMPIEIPTGMRSYQASFSPHRDEIGKAKVALERKETQFVSSNNQMIQKTFESDHKTKNQREFNAIKQNQRTQPHFQRKKSLHQGVHKPFDFNHKAKNELELIGQKQSQKIRPNYNRSNSNSHFDEESLQSLMKERKAALEMLSHAPSSIISASKRDPKEQINRSTHGYLNFVRRMNINQSPITETEGELIASIRGKYGK